MKARSLGLIFVTAVIVPSTLLAVLSVRAAGREEAFVERQLATTLDAETARAAALANAAVGRMVDELQAGIDIPAGADYGVTLRKWKAGDALVDVPFLLSPRYGILWPAGAGSGNAEKSFLREQGDFLSDRTTTTILQNIADRYQKQILAQAAAGTAAASTAPASAPAGSAALSAQAAPATVPAAVPGDRAGPSSSGGPPPAAAAERSAAADAVIEPPAAGAASAPSAAQDTEAATANRQMALDAFAQSPAIQSEVYQAAAAKGDQLSARVAQPVSKALSNAPAVLPPAAAPAPAPTTAATGAASTTAAGPSEEATTPADAGAGSGAKKSAEGVEGTSAAAGNAEGALVSQPTVPPIQPTAAPTQPTAARTQPTAERTQLPQAQPSQYVVTSQLLSQIASAGRAGIIPRFTNAGLVFLFWERQDDGRIAGCQVDSSLFRARISAVLEGTTTASRIITFLDENGAPLAAPPGDTGREWRRPFVSREIGASLPRWEAAAYLTDPGAISSQARSTRLVIWIMVLILFVSVAGGGTLVLSSVYGEMRTAQQKATFVTNVSHELKTPLTSISLFVELLRKKGPLSAEKRESYLAHMASETERLTRLINNVLDFSGTRRYALESLDAAVIAEEVLEGQRVRLESLGFTVTMAPPPEECIVRADPGSLKQVLLNLLSNAEKYSRERREIEVRVEAGGGQVRIRVLDRGIGVPEKERGKIFREFYRVDDALASRVRGTGLGLTIARRIVRDHGGDITCTPRDGGGSDFTVSLPGAAGGEEG